MTESSDETTGIRNESGEIDIDVDARVGRSMSTDEGSLDDGDVEQIEKEREQRLDPDNRPVNAIVDNTQRDFDAEAEEFTVPAEEVENGPRPLDETTDDSDDS